jgi:hypothetical protein
LSIPLTVILFFSAVTVRPSGMFTLTGCENPKARFKELPESIGKL